MRTTLNLDDDVYASVMTLSRLSGDSLGKVVSKLVRKAINDEEPAYAPGFPTFSVAPDAPIIGGNRAAELLADET